ncbi:MULTISPECIES: CatA-like O-acetyltransferase [unclassified Paenibacillus]
MLPVSLQLHHVVCGGYHAGLLVGELQRLADYSKEWINDPKEYT